MTQADLLEEQNTDLEEPAVVEPTVIEHLSMMPVKAEINLLPETIKLINDAASFDKLDIQIKTVDERVTGNDQRAKIKGLVKLLDAKRSEMKKPFDDAGKEVQEYFNPRLDALKRADKAIESAMISFDDEQERQRKLAAAKAEEEARKEREKLAARAEKLEEKGKTEQAEAVKENAATVVAAPVAIAVAPMKMTGESRRVTYSAEVTDANSLIKAVAAPMLMREAGNDPAKLFQIVMELAMANVPAIAVIPDTKFLDKQAVALKEHFSYPGCKIATKTAIAARSANPLK